MNIFNFRITLDAEGMKVNFPDEFSRKSSVVEEVLQDEDLHPVQVGEEKPNPNPTPKNTGSDSFNYNFVPKTRGKLDTKYLI